MCYGQKRPFSRDNPTASRTVRSPNDNAVAVEDLRGRLAETEARLTRARAREAELNRRLEEMKRFVSVMEILETYLRRRFREQQECVSRICSASPTYGQLYREEPFVLVTKECCYDSVKWITAKTECPVCGKWFRLCSENKSSNAGHDQNEKLDGISIIL